METTFVQDLNYLRIKSLMEKTAKPVIRIQFDKYFPFHNLSKIIHQYASELENMKKQFIIRTHDWTLMFPPIGTPSAAVFDISLMISLLEYLVFKGGDGKGFNSSINTFAKPMQSRMMGIPGVGWTNATPIQSRMIGIPGVGWQNVGIYKPSNEMPSDQDITKAADIRRIRLIRKTIIENGEKKLSNREFQKLWNDLSSAVIRLGGTPFERICDNIKAETFTNDNDISNENQGLTKKTKDELKDALLQGTFKSYENKIYLAGPCQSGKTSLACILVGNNIPKTWNSTNGLMIYNGQTGIQLRNKTMNPLPDNQTVDLQEVALCDIIDFGGQDAFDMLHQLFISQRGTFCFLFDGRKNMSDTIENDRRTIADVLMHWINLILTYCDSQSRGFPKIVVVATHRDKIQENDVEKRRTDLVAQIEDVIGLHPLRHHILYDDLALINTQDKNDTEVDCLKSKLVNIAFLQPTWGEKMPKRWRYLQESITKLRLKGKMITERNEIIQLNKNNAEAALPIHELETFLKVQHALGKVMYFDTALLRNIIIIDPLCMVTLLKSFVTDVQFWPEDDELRTIHKSLCDTGILTKVDLFKLWEQPEFEMLKSHKEEMASILVDLDVLVQPKDYSKESGEQLSNFYFVPCVVRQEDSTNYLKEHCTNENSISLTYKFSSSVIIPAFAFRLFGTCLSMWECKEYEGRKMLFRDSVTVSFDVEHDICICLEASRINIHLIHKEIKSCIEWNVATSIQECITDALEKILLFYAGTFGGSVRFHQTRSLSLFTFEFKLPCGKKECFAPEFIRNFTPESSWICVNKERHEVKWLLLWFPRITFVDQTENPVTDDSHSTGDIDIHSIPTDLQMRRFVIQFAIDDFRNIMVNLEMDVSRIEQLFEEHRRLHDAMFYCMWNWKESEENPTFLLLRNALEESELSPDYLLKAIELKTAKTCLSSELEDMVPTEMLLRKLSRIIGKEVFQLAIELGLEVQDYEDIEYSCNYRNLQEQAHAVLRKWRESQPKPTIGQLANAMVNINRDAKILVKLIS